MSLLLLNRIRNFFYDHKILKSVRSTSYVISVGNLTWGGTGKTSLILELGQFLISKGFRIALISRGYRRNTTGPLLISDGKSLKASWAQSGDEAYLLASSLPEAIVVVAEKRSAGFKLVEPFYPDVILLDDAFQHRQAARDLDIVLIDASEDITEQKGIPFGKLRESPKALSRADAVILTHEKHSNEETVRWVQKNVTIPVFHANHLMEENQPLRGQKIGAFCAIGSPQHFFKLLQDEGAEIVAAKSFQDHHVFTRQEVEEFEREAAVRGASWIATTAKDAVRMESETRGSSIKVIRVKLQIAEEALFYEFVLNSMTHSRSNLESKI